MEGPVVVEILSALIGGLCIFLLGMKNMSDGMQAIAGSKLRRMIAAITDNRFFACGTGAFVTSLIQSSSVTTVMVVGMVNAGVMTLKQAIGVILGADIGTTITAWIVSLDILEYGLPMLGLAGFIFLFTKNERLRYSAMMVMGIGMVFFGLELMKNGLYPLRESEAFVAWFSKFSPDTFGGLVKCIMVGAGVTAVVQSSSATVAITITLARTGVIDYETAVALVLGENIGTTITAYLASLGAGTNARRVAYAHISIKIIGVAIMACVFPFYIGILNRTLSVDMDIAKRIAFAHTFFNIFIVCIFLPSIALLAAFLIRLAPDKAHKEPPKLTFLDVRLLDSPAFGIQQSADEIYRMSDGVEKMMVWLRATVEEDDRDEVRERKLFHREELLDIMQKEIVEFLGSLLSGSVPNDVMIEARRQLRIADEYESISDYAVSIIKLRLKIEANGRKMSDKEQNAILALHDHVSEYLQMISAAVKDANPSILSKALSQGATITHIVKDTRDAHITRVEQQHSSALSCLIFVDILQAYRKIKDHALNIAEALAGEK